MVSIIVSEGLAAGAAAVLEALAAAATGATVLATASLEAAGGVEGTGLCHKCVSIDP